MIEVATNSSSPAVQAAIAAGLVEWNTLLNDAPTSYRRSFSWSGTDTSFADVIVEVDGPTSATFCGKEGDGRIWLYQLGTVDCPTAGSWYGDIATVVAHELATVIGWHDDVERKGVAGVSNEYCVITWRSLSPGPLSTNACYQDADGIHKLYRHGSVSLGSFDDYFGTRILATSDVALSATTVQAGESVAIVAQYLSAGPHAQYSATVPYGPSNYGVLFSDPTKAHQVGSTVVADAPGTIQVTVRPVNIPAGYSLWEPLLSEGRSFTLTITEPPPPPTSPFKVDSIWAAQMPITTPQWTTVWARVVNPPGSPTALRWIITDSRTPSVSDTIFAWGNQIDLNATAGSYTFTIRARPQYGSTFGLEFTQDIPVCTESAMKASGWSAESAGSKAVALPSDTDAVGGCSGEN